MNMKKSALIDDRPFIAILEMLSKAWFCPELCGPSRADPSLPLYNPTSDSDFTLQSPGGESHRMYRLLKSPSRGLNGGSSALAGQQVKVAASRL
jgi:hypothetical protein